MELSHAPPAVDRHTVGSKALLRRRPASAPSLRRLLDYSDDADAGGGGATSRCAGRRQPDVGGALSIVSVETIQCRH